LFTWRNLRQQSVKRQGVDNKCLADYIAPRETGVADYIGMFAVTGGLGIEKHEQAFQQANDDYSSIMLKALADRFAEGFAECLHADRKSTRLNSSHVKISYAVFCLKKKTK